MKSITYSDTANAWNPLIALPYMLAVWCCLSILQQHSSDIPPLVTLGGTIAIVCGCVAAIHAVAFLLLRTINLSHLTHLITSVFVAYIGLHSPVSAVVTSAFQLIDAPAFLIVWSIAYAALIVCIVACRPSVDSVSRPAAAIVFTCAVLLLMQTVNVVPHLVADASQLRELDQTIEHLAAKESITFALPTDLPDKQQRPDIYYIIPDAYARQDVLRDVYDHDNTDFIEALQSRGFFVGDDSCSNYIFTEFSLASSLNLRHLDAFDLASYETRMPLRHLIRNSAVATALKQIGYRTYAIETGKSETECDNFDQYVAHGQSLNDYQDVLYHGTPLPTLLAATGAVRSAARRHGDRVLFAIDQVPTLAKQSADPAFVFCHLLAPHPPYLFDGDGNEVEYRGRYLLSDCTNFTSCYDYDLNVYRDGYREQIKFVNQKLLTMIDRIRNSDRPSVIILQADHGPRLGLGYPSSAPASREACYRESFSILNAISIPGQRHSSLPSNLTPVNTFRLLFNELFGTELTLQANKSYTNADFKFADVTHYASPVAASQNNLANDRPQPLKALAATIE